MGSKAIEKAFDLARQKYADLGVDVVTAMKVLSKVSLSMHCWQGDDVGGFESQDASLGGGLAVTGNYPGKARTLDELRQDLDKVLSLVPGKHRVNLHAIYGDFGGKKVDRDQIDKSHFQTWVAWAKERKIGLDFNATCFSHPLAEDGFTLSHPKESTRCFWVEHVKRCRAIASWMGKSLKTPSIHNLWIPDGSKDETVNRLAYRSLLRKSLYEIIEDSYPPDQLKDSVESKLFGIGSESFVVGSYDFYLPWAAKNNTMLCLDMGHYHPTESVADKVSAMLLFLDEILVHVSRGVRWDSDHVVTFHDPLLCLMQEIVRARALARVHLALDYFDASINRVAAYVIGARATLKALLFALLEPIEKLREFERAGDYSARLALLEQAKSMPFGAIWDAYCLKLDIPEEGGWMAKVREYEKKVQSKRA